MRHIAEDDLDIFFNFQQDEVAVHMAAFTSANPSDRAAFDTHWTKLLGSDVITKRTILLNHTVVGNVMSFEMFGDLEITYWIDRTHWNNGIATKALELFLEDMTIRPLFGRVAKDNVGSRRVLEKCGFGVVNEEKGFANARGMEIEELVLKLV